MKQNMGGIDRVFRALVAIAIIVLYSAGIISGVLAIVLLLIAGIFILTGIFAICPLYSLLHVNTCRGKKI